MRVGVVKEVKKYENRSALVPAGCEQLVRKGHEVLVERGAGAASGFPDEEYAAVGARVTEEAGEVWEKSDLILKVKEPMPSEYTSMREGQMVFTYFHFAASESLTQAFLRSGAVALAYETLETPSGNLPLLTPMSEVAGRMAVMQGAKYLEREHGGRGVLLGGVPGVQPATVVILGAGVVGANAARTAAGLGAMVCVLDVNLERLRYLADVMPPNVITMMSNPVNLRNALRDADVVISSVLVRGGKAPRLITRQMLSLMKRGSVMVDVAIDQGGSTETSRPTTHEAPIYEVDGVIHYCVTNMPGAMPLTATLALTNATLPYVLELADKGWKRAARENGSIARSLNIVQGRVTYANVAEAFGLEWTPVDTLLT